MTPQRPGHRGVANSWCPRQKISCYSPFNPPKNGEPRVSLGLTRQFSRQKALQLHCTELACWQFSSFLLLLHCFCLNHCSVDTVCQFTPLICLHTFQDCSIFEPVLTGIFDSWLFYPPTVCPPNVLTLFERPPSHIAHWFCVGGWTVWPHVFKSMNHRKWWTNCPANCMSTRGWCQI